MGIRLVLSQCDNCAFRAAPMHQDKEQAAGNGAPLAKACEAVLAHWGGSLQARREAVIHGVALTLLRCKSLDVSWRFSNLVSTSPGNHNVSN